MEINDDSQGVKSKYFIAFKYRSADGGYGDANTLIERISPVCGREDLLDITSAICSCIPDMEEVVITNWRRFEDPE
jgi:hypothetical protein